MLKKYTQLSFLIILLSTQCIYSMDHAATAPASSQTLGQKLTAITHAARASKRTLCESAGISQRERTPNEKSALAQALLGKKRWWYETTRLEHSDSPRKINFNASGTRIAAVIDISGDDTDDETPSPLCAYQGLSWNLETEQFKRTQPLQAMGLNSSDLQQANAHVVIVDDTNICVFDNEGILSAVMPLVYDSTIHIVDPDETIVLKNECHKKVCDVTLYPKQHLVSLTLKKVGASLWDYASGKMILHLPGAHKIACDPKGTLIASIEDNANRTRAAYIRDYNGTLLHALQQSPVHGVDRNVWDVAFNPHQNMIATAYSEGAYLWNYKGELLRTLVHSAEPLTHVLYVTFNPQGTLLCTSAADGTVCLWHCHLGDKLHTFYNDLSLCAPAFAPQGHTIATVSGAYVRLWQQYEQPTLEQVLLYKVIQQWLISDQAEKEATKLQQNPDIDLPAWLAAHCNLHEHEVRRTWHTLPDKVRKSLFMTITDLAGFGKKSMYQEVKDAETRKWLEFLFKIDADDD
ncbi:MAG: WD40 repeat domain-containing protein [Candidatus Babeliales bacterium]